MKRIIIIVMCLILLSLSGCILVNPKTLDFSSDETTKTFKLTVIGDVEWSIIPDESWIAVEPDSGQVTETITITVDRAGLDDGSYEAILNISTNPNIPCPDVIVKMIVGETTTSSTTTSIDGDNTTTTSIIDGGTTTTSPTTITTTTISGGGPDPYFLSEGRVKFYYDKLGKCLGGQAFIDIGNRGDGGDVFLGLSANSSPPTSACRVIYMEKGEVREGSVWSANLCRSPHFELTIKYEVAPAKEGDKEICNNAPDVRITSPKDGSTFSPGEGITFNGEAYDYEDYDDNPEPMPEGSLVWTSNVDGQIGTGYSFVRNDLSLGEHTITLTATDSLDKDGTAAISILID